MPVVVEIQGGDELRKFLGGIPAAQYKGARAAFSDAVLGAQKEVLSHLSGNPMQTRSGTLARSITPQVLGTDLTGLSGRIYTGVIYAPIHETGGTVTAKRAYTGVPGGPYLNIPTSDNKTAAGVQRMTARQVFDAGGYVFKAKSGNYAVGMDGKTMFILRKQVTIKPQLGMETSADNQIQTLMSALQSMALE